jgi:predicted amidohydrolase YtcJ
MSKSVKSIILILALAFLPLAFCNRQKTPPTKADLVLSNGNVVTVSDELPRAQAVAISGNRIIYVGDDSGARPFVGQATKVIDLGQKLVIPGFIDAHLHPSSAGRALTILDLKGLSKEQILEKVALKVKELKKGEWIEAVGWDQGFWKEREFPTRYELDAVAPDNPAALSRIDGHSGWYNSLAFRLSKIDRTTKDPEGGRILRDASGEPTGMLIDEAMSLIERGEDGEGPERKETYIKLVMEQYRKWGVTGIQDAGADGDSLQVYEKLKQRGELTVRVYAMVSSDSNAFTGALNQGPRVDDFLTERSVKMLIDGALGSRGALLFEPYSDAPDTSGLQMMTEEKAYSIIKSSIEKGFQVSTHAIGDKAVRMMLDLYKKALNENPVKDPRLRIEHASVVRKEDLPAFTEMNVIACVQPIFVGEYGRWSEDRLGPQRVKDVLILRDMLDAGVAIAGGTDCPASDSGNPILNFYAAVTRKSPFGVPNEWYGRQKITREEALRMLTIGAAYAAFEENRKGSLEAGKLADLVVLDRDIMTIDEEQIPGTEVVMTVLDGKIIYSR